MQSAFLPVALLLSLGVVTGVRVKRRQTKTTTKEPGQVHGLYAFGSPSVATPAFENPRGGPCFPGKRFWTANSENWWGKGVDTATTITGTWPLNYRHLHMDAYEIDLTAKTVTEFPCSGSEEDTDRPSGWHADTHFFGYYRQYAQKMSQHMRLMSHFMSSTAFTFDREGAERDVSRFGWTIVGSALVEGGDIYVGRQVSHLIQQPQTGECVLTFPGSDSWQDWTSNINVVRSHFCGFVRPGMFCAANESSCPGLLKGESYVHMGFRDALRQIIRDPKWQSDVRPKFSNCSKVYVTGHSKGGGQAALFTACAQKAPQPGEYGYEEDYKYIAW